MVSYGPYADSMRVVAQQHEIPLFDRLAIMRNWSDTGAFDLYAAGKDNVLAQRVHEARRLLEETDLPIDAVAWRAGFGTAASLREHFRRATATTPTAYRRSFGLAAA